MGLLPAHGRHRAGHEQGRLTHRFRTIRDFAEATAAARAAAETGAPLLLLSAPDAGITAGAGWWRGLLAALHEDWPGLAVTAILDCADQPGAALAAIRAGVADILFTGRPDVADRLADMAAQAGLRLWREPPC